MGVEQFASRWHDLFHVPPPKSQNSTMKMQCWAVVTVVTSWKPGRQRFGSEFYDLGVQVWWLSYQYLSVYTYNIYIYIYHAYIIILIYIYIYSYVCIYICIHHIHRLEKVNRRLIDYLARTRAEIGVVPRRSQAHLFRQRTDWPTNCSCVVDVSMSPHSTQWDSTSHAAQTFAKLVLHMWHMPERRNRNGLKGSTIFWVREF